MRERIVELRKILGLTQQQFGDKLGIGKEEPSPIMRWAKSPF